jgi:xanthine dehydrogenase YagR molybdenum-binding subunit
MGTTITPVSGSIVKTGKSTIGTKVPRIDGPLKTTGGAKYTSDYNLPNMVYAVPVCATIASGAIKRMDTAQAGQMRGVVRIYHHGNAPKLYRPNPADQDNYMDEKRPAFEDEKIYYSGQYVAVVVAETMDQARAAARAVRVEYTAEKPNVARDLSDGFSTKMEEAGKRGDVEAAFSAAPVKIDATYVTPIETHNPIELHASVANWDGRRYILYETTQSLKNHQAVMAQVLGVPPEQIQIVMKFLGSGFGGKLWPWTHAPLAAAISRDLNRPVKLVVDRHMMFTNVGHRPRTQQLIRLGATPDGKLTAVQHDYVNDTSLLDQVSEDCKECTPYIYSTPNLRVRSALVSRNLGTPTAMRGPGAVPGLFALESAMDELAIALKMDPVQLRMINEPEKDESNGLPFSSRHLKECLTTGAEKFGWAKRTPEVGSMKRGDLTLGWGVAACSWGAMRMACEASFAFNDDGSVRVSCATQDIGTGTYTVFAQAVHAKTGVPLDKITVALGDSTLPAGPMSGGSWATASVLPSISGACDSAVEQMITIAIKGPGAPFANNKPEELTFSDGRVHLKSQPAASGHSFDTILRSMNTRSVRGEGKSDSSFTNENMKKYSLHSYGAHFVEVEWDADIARLRVSRVVSVIDVGQVINLGPARNQIEGAIVMGIGMGMFEETIYDQRTGHPVNNNLADYILTTSADCPEIDVHFLNHPDLVLNELGARGAGEIGLAGVAPAITAAVYHATGVRVRELPVKIETLLAPARRV